MTPSRPAAHTTRRDVHSALHASRHASAVSGRRRRSPAAPRRRARTLARAGRLPRLTVRSRSMLGLDVPMLATTFFSDHRNELTALLTVAGTIALAIVVD